MKASRGAPDVKMSIPGPTAEVLGRIAYELALIQPFIPTYLHLLVAALFPIYTGAHASLSRPRSAADSGKETKLRTENIEEDEDVTKESDQRMEGLSPTDAILYPVLTGCMLGALYFLIKWLKDPTILNKILNWYLSIFGVLAITKLLTDSMSIVRSFIFPTRYSDNGVIWEVRRKQRLVISSSTTGATPKVPNQRLSPLPGPLSRITLSHRLNKALWALREFPTQGVYVLEAYMRGLSGVRVSVNTQDRIGLSLAVLAVLYFNLVDKPWWLTNLIGFSFSYSALQLMSPTTCWTGTLVLTALFFYDIYFVFFTPLMITVATNLDIPVKLLFPRPPGVNDDPNKKALSMLGLGDIVIPGMMIGFALRFDLYLFYLRKQTRQRTVQVKDPVEELEPKETSEDKTENTTREILKAQYQSATGSWGERFWLRSQDHHWIDGGIFPKTYFHATIVGYVLGMLCTLGVMQVYQHGQPALLYLVPGVLGSLWGTALVKGDLKTMWEYSEADEQDETKADEKLDSKAIENPTSQAEGVISEDLSKDLTKVDSGKPHTGAEAKDSKFKPGTQLSDEKCVVYFSINISKKPDICPTTQPPSSKKVKPARSLEEELRRASERLLGAESSSSSSRSSPDSSSRRRSLDVTEDGPAGKRQRIE